ncbi:hypothetical protein [Gloeobacter violaceus]|nr:hypothetical protein [Gloeobacter violaceus]
MSERPRLRVDLQTHRQHLEQARENLDALRQWSEQLQYYLERLERQHAQSPLGQFQARQRTHQQVVSLSE